MTDAFGLPDPTPDTVVITVSDVPIAGLSLADSSPTMAGQAVHFTTTITAGSNVTYTWDFGDGTPVAGGGSTATHTYQRAGLYLTVVTASNGAGTATATTISSVAIAVPLAPRQGSSLVYTDSQGLTTTVDVPHGAMTRTALLIYTPLFSPTHPLPAGKQFANHAFQVDVLPWYFLFVPPCPHNVPIGDWMGTSAARALPGRSSAKHGPAATVQSFFGPYPASLLTRSAPELSLQKPVTITVYYSDDDVAGLDESALQIVYWTGSAWDDVVNTCTPPSTYIRDLDANVISVVICHLTEFDLISE